MVVYLYNVLLRKLFRFAKRQKSYFFVADFFRTFDCANIQIKYKVESIKFKKYK